MGWDVTYVKFVAVSAGVRAHRRAIVPRGILGRTLRLREGQELALAKAAGGIRHITDYFEVGLSAFSKTAAAAIQKPTNRAKHPSEIAHMFPTLRGSVRKEKTPRAVPDARAHSSKSQPATFKSMFIDRIPDCA